MNLTVYGLYLARAGARIAARCADYDIDATAPILLVMACDGGPARLASEVAAWGERPLVVGKDGALSGVLPLRADNLTGFARQYPNRLLATAATGLPRPREADGSRPLVWADLGESTPVEVGDFRARVS